VALQAADALPHRRQTPQPLLQQPPLPVSAPPSAAAKPKAGELVRNVGR